MGCIYSDKDSKCSLAPADRPVKSDPDAFTYSVDDDGYCLAEDSPYPKEECLYYESDEVDGDDEDDDGRDEDDELECRMI